MGALLQDYIETPRLLLRKPDESDLYNFFRLESDPVVQQYVSALSHSTISTPEQAEEALNSIIQQHDRHGIARMAVIEKSSGRFIGLAGVKWHPEPINNHTYFFDLGYRLLPGYWGKGYATEAAQAAYDHCISVFKPLRVYAFVHVDNHSSRGVLAKLSFRYMENFSLKGAPMCWYERSSK